MKVGRIKAHMIATVIGVIGVLISLVLNPYSIVIGRIIFGASIGIVSSVAPRYI